MKNIISTLAFSCFIAASVKADHRLSDLRIRTYENMPVIVKINQQQQSNSPGNVVQINDIQPGRHAIKIWTAVAPYAYRPGKIVLYNGYIDIPAASRVNASLTRNRILKINEIRPLYAPMVPPPFYGPTPYPLPGPYTAVPAPLCMEEVEFNELLATIDHQSFESTRMQIAKQAIRQHGYINSYQVIELLRLMSFESSKLELAKYAYEYTVDKENYFRLFNEFSFDSSVRELSAFIG